MNGYDKSKMREIRNKRLACEFVLFICPDDACAAISNALQNPPIAAKRHPTAGRAWERRFVIFRFAALAGLESVRAF